MRRTLVGVGFLASLLTSMGRVNAQQDLNGGEIDKLLFKLAAYVLLIGSVLLFGITFAAHKIQNSLTPAPADPPPKAAAGG